MSRNHGSKHTDPTSRLVESTAIVHRRWLLCVGIMLGISIGVGVTHVMPYTWWSYAVIATGIAAVLAEMGAAVWWSRLVWNLDEFARARTEATSTTGTQSTD